MDGKPWSLDGIKERKAWSLDGLKLEEELAVRKAYVRAWSRPEPTSASLAHEFGHMCDQGDQAGPVLGSSGVILPKRRFAREIREV
jgi:hypothetical protein